MNTSLNNAEKREYIAPAILVITLDNEISLQLESTPPVPGDEELSVASEFFNPSPFHMQNG